MRKEMKMKGICKRPWCNYHTHSLYCDGKDSIENFVKTALEKKFDYLGFSSHAPIPRQTDFAISEQDIPNYLRDIRESSIQNSSLTLFAGLECDFISDTTQSFRYYKEKYHLDYIIGGVHLVKPVHKDEWWFIDGSKVEMYDDGLRNLFGGDVKKAVTRFWEQTFEMIETEEFDIIAHMDKIKMHNQNRYFTQDESWYVKLVDHSLQLIKKKGLIIEINSRGIYKGRCPEFYPSDYIIHEAAKMDIPFVISTDAHKADELGLLHEEAYMKLNDLGVRNLCFLENEKWKQSPL